MLIVTKQEFIEQCKCTIEPKLIVTVTQLPSGALETQINTDQLETKMNYIVDNYDENMCLKRNTKVQIIGVIVA
ncbi:hypothetical protein D3C75_333050 [compost metagenome]